MVLVVKNPPVNAGGVWKEVWVPSLGQEDPLEESLATHSSILARRIPWKEAWWATVLGVAELGTTERLTLHYLSISFPGGSDGKESVSSVGDPCSIPGLGRSPGEGNGYPLQYSCLENSMDRGAWFGYSPWGRKE